MDTWKFIIILLGFSFTIYKYFDAREKELKWRKTETLLALGREFDSDKNIIEAILILEKRGSVSIEDIYDAEGEPNNSSHAAEAQAIDRLLNFLDRIAYSVEELETISLKEANQFGWYFNQILSNSRLTKYCDKYGFHDLVQLANKI